MKNVYYLLLSVTMLTSLVCCNNSVNKLTPEQIDSINKATEDSIRVADSIAEVEMAIADSIAKVEAAEKEAKISKLKGKFRTKKDDFEDRTWVYHNSTPYYSNRNSVHLYFMMKDGEARNLRFRVQYTSDDWLFIQDMIFNIDGENVRFYPTEMERDNNYDIWEWCDEPAYSNSSLVDKIANAKSVKIKFNGRQYYNTRTMTAAQIKGFKETLEYYKLLGGTY